MEDIFLDSWKEFLGANSRELVVEARKKKPDCAPSNKWHDEDGKFSSKANAAVWGGGYEHEGAEDCTYGKFKTRGDGRKLITKHKCGRDGESKHPWKCKNGEAAFEGLLDEEEISIDSAYLSGIVRREVLAALQSVADKNGCSFGDLLRATAAYAQAEKGGPKVSGEK